MMNNGTYGIIDDLTINYDGNRLLSVTDDAESLNYAGALDFHDGANMTAEYAYDANGALTRDSNRGISSIVYDYSHNPHMVYCSSGSRLNDYSSDGRKLSCLHSINSSGSIYYNNVVSDTYIDGLVLRNDIPQTWQFDGGYITLDANGAATSWNYYVTDHLGSTRKVVTSANAVKETINYYPYGSEMTMTTPSLSTNPNWQPFRFSGKELDKLNGLNMYDFGARWFDVAGVPVWTSVDPLAEDNCPVTPYSYCNGDPVNRIDPDGMIDYKVNVYGQMYEATSFWEKLKALLGHGCNQDRIFMEDSGKLIVTLPENSIQNLEKQELVLGDEEITQTSFTIVGNANANKVYEALTNNTNVEWVAIEDRNNKMAATILTDHNSTDASSGINVLMDYERKTSSTIFRHNHFLTQDDYHGSEFERQARLRPSGDDMSVARAHPKTTFFLDDKTNKQTLRYDGYKYWKVKKPY